MLSKRICPRKCVVTQKKTRKEERKRTKRRERSQHVIWGASYKKSFGKGNLEAEKGGGHQEEKGVKWLSEKKRLSERPMEKGQ